MIGIAALLLIAAPTPSHAPTASKLAGLYETHQMEMAGGLELKPDGHFRYAFSYGAVDEEAGGNWTFDGETVRLTSNPVPVPPHFELVRDDPAPLGELYMKLEEPGFSWGGPLRAVIKARGMPGAFEVAADETGRVGETLPTIVGVTPLMPVYGPTGDTFDVAPDRGHRLLFRFHANDLGTAAFASEPLKCDGDDLLLNRYETVIRFERIRPEER